MILKIEGRDPNLKTRLLIAPRRAGGEPRIESRSRPSEIFASCPQKMEHVSLLRESAG
ncbi:MAG: hypothetical protein Q4E01_03115 [Actinomycetaceae bacterium]|nr:hypothetical protein [Actinomycetaceae bacterium]